MKKQYYKAYDERYKTIHSKNVSWSSNIPTPIVMQTIKDYNFTNKNKMLEIGCGEARDAHIVLKNNYSLLATDVSKQAILYCKKIYQDYKDNFKLLDCLNDKLADKYDFIYSIAVIHMLLLKEHRNQFYKFIYDHLNDDGIALICSMGDGKTSKENNIDDAFLLQKRNHEIGEVMVASTSLKMVTLEEFNKEILDNGFKIIKEGITSSLPDFNNLMYAIIKKDK